MATTQNDKQAEALKTAGNKFFTSKRYARAVSKYTDALLVKPSADVASGILVNRSAAYALLDKFDLAIADAQLAANRRPRFAKAHVRLAEAYGRKQAHLQAKRAWESAAEYAENDEDRQRYTDYAEKALKAANKTAVRNEPVTSQIVLSKPGDNWFEKSKAVREAGPRPPSAQTPFAVSMYAWYKCESAWHHIDNAVRPVEGTGQCQTDLFNPYPLCEMAEVILTDTNEGFHIPPPRPGARMGLVDKLSHLINAEADAGGFSRYFDGGWSAKAIIDDLDRRIYSTFNGRYLVRRYITSMIYGKIISAAILMTKGQFGTAVEMLRQTVNLHDEGNAKWAHEDQSVRGNVFGPTIARNTKAVLVRCLLAGHRGATTPTAKNAFPLREIEKWAQTILDSPLKEIYWYMLDQTEPWFRLCFNNLPLWEANAALGYVNHIRVLESLGDLPEGEIVYADKAAAQKCAEYYDAAAALMPDDFHDKRIMLYCALYGHIRAGGLTLGEIRSRAAEADRCDALVSPYFGPMPSPFEQFDFAQAQISNMPTIPSHVLLRAVPSLRVPRGRDPNEFITPQTWGPEGLGEDAGTVDVLQLKPTGGFER